MIACSQAFVVAAIEELAKRWGDPQDPFRQASKKILIPFPFAMTKVSLDGLLASMTSSALWDLIDKEGVREAYGAARIGHIIAGNTPLLSWTSLLRALLMRSHSLVKLPSSEIAEWGFLFRDSLAAVSSDLADFIELHQWKGGISEQDLRIYSSVDLLIAYGSDRTISQIRKQCPDQVPLIGYGHRLSFGVVLAGAEMVQAAIGFAHDILLYDQGGCLSPQIIYIEGNREDASLFAGQLASALADTVPLYPLNTRSFSASSAVQEARSLAKMDDQAQLWEDPDLRWTVIAHNDSIFKPSGGYGIVTVKPFTSINHLLNILKPMERIVQGCAVAGKLNMTLPGVSYMCSPGKLQAPPLSWPEDGISPLRSLMI
jgi:hypothetical protein